VYQKILVYCILISFDWIKFFDVIDFIITFYVILVLCVYAYNNIIHATYFKFVSSYAYCNHSISNSYLLTHQTPTFAHTHVRTFHQYVDWVNTNDPEAEWNGEEACHIYAHKNGVDLFKGTYYILHTVPPLAQNTLCY
jgi:hypothetical protein